MVETHTSSNDISPIGFMGNEPLEKCNILIVDDRPDSLAAMESVLSELGQNLVLATSGMDALRKLLQNDFAVILLDVQMPVMDGFETASLIRKRPRSAHTPIIFITAIEKSVENVQHGYAQGAVDYIFKPYNPGILKAKVSVFVTLYQMTAQVRQQAEKLEQAYLQLERRSKDLEALNKELESFSYSVSHDMRAPLNTLASFCKILRDTYQTRLDDQGQDLLRRMVSATEWMNGIIDGLLTLSRTVRVEPQLARVNLSSLATEIISGLRQREPSRAVEFTCRPGMTAYADERLMRVLLNNLLGNAWKFTQRKERARIEFSMIDPPPPDGILQDMGEGLPTQNLQTPVYYVSDNGAGFEQEYVAKLFTPFQRLHSQSEFPGHGIGLATVARIVRRHYGRVWAKGQVDQGATFYFTLSDLESEDHPVIIPETQA